jgi:hypothetical protein
MDFATRKIQGSVRALDLLWQNPSTRWILQLEKSKDLSGRLTSYELADDGASALRARPGCFQLIGPGAVFQQGRSKKVKCGADMQGVQG